MDDSFKRFQQLLFRTHAALPGFEHEVPTRWPLFLWENPTTRDRCRWKFLCRFTRHPTGRARAIGESADEFGGRTLLCNQFGLGVFQRERSGRRPRRASATVDPHMELRESDGQRGQMELRLILFISRQKLIRMAADDFPNI